MQNIFQQHPFSTQVGVLIERATDGNLPSPDWSLNLEICDLINETDEGPKDAIRAVRKRLLSAAGKSNTSIWYTLLVVETCAKNCGRRFHLQVANKEFLHDFTKVIAAKWDPPIYIQDKVLTLIHIWADAFKGNPDLKEVEKLYDQLRQKGVDFPPIEGNVIPIRTPKRSSSDIHPGQHYLPKIPNDRRNLSMRTALRQDLADGRSGSLRSHTGHMEPAVQQQQRARAAPGNGTTDWSSQPRRHQATLANGSSPGLTPEQRVKLGRELAIVEGNVAVLGDMLSQLLPETISDEELRIMQELNRTCRAMQQRLVELLDEVAIEAITSELLRINDDLNNAFLCYDRFERYHSSYLSSDARQLAITGGSSSNQLAITGAPRHQTSTVSNSLVDLSTPPPQPSQGYAGSCVAPSFMSTAIGRAGSDVARPGSPDSSILPTDSASHFGGGDPVRLSIRGTSPASAGAVALASDDFDVLAVSRYQANGGALLDDIANSDETSLPDMVEIPETPEGVDFDEVENWLQIHESAAKGNSSSDVLSSNDFDKFISDQVRLTAAQVQQKKPTTSNESAVSINSGSASSHSRPAPGPTTSTTVNQTEPQDDDFPIPPDFDEALRVLEF